MSPERKQQRPDIDPEYPHTIADILEATGMPGTASSKSLVRRRIDKNALAPLTHPDGSVTLSEADFKLVVKIINEKKENGSLRTDLESATLPDGIRITGGKTLHIRQITAIVTKARGGQRPFSLEEIMNALHPTPKISNASKATARTKALNLIQTYRKKIKPNGWVIDSITPMQDKEGRKNPQYWFRHKDEPPFTSLPDAKPLTKKTLYFPMEKELK